MSDKAKELAERWGAWGDHPAYPVQDWKYQIENNDTREGYWDWVLTQIWLGQEAD